MSRCGFNLLIMKKLFLTILGVLVFSSAFAIKVETHVTAAYRADDGVYCCFEMLHLFFTDEGLFMTYGTSKSGTCCPNNGLDIITNGLTENEISELESFSLTQSFINSQFEAINLYKVENGIGYQEMDGLPMTNGRKIEVAPFMPPHGVGSLAVIPREDGKLVPQKVIE